MTGHEVRRLHAGALAAGVHSIAWDGRDRRARPTPPGIYLIVAVVGGETTGTRVVRIR